MNNRERRRARGQKASVTRALSDRFARVGAWRRRLQWRLAHPGQHDTRPLFIFGAQRSGTGMLGNCLGASPACENLGESDPRAFQNYWLREPAVIGPLIDDCPYSMLVFKPLKDSHRVAEVLAIRPAARGIWAYRSFVDRINSAVQQFGRRPLQVFSALRNGEPTPWQLLGMSAHTAEAIRAFDPAGLSESDGAALIWWVRNSLYFDQGLDRDPRMRLWSYDRFVLNSEAELRALLAHAGADYDPRMLKVVHGRSVGKKPAPRVEPRILALCEELHTRLEAAREAGERRLSTQA